MRTDGSGAKREQGPIRMAVPFYGQSHDHTCGPACLMMAMAYFDESITLEHDLEMDIWREATLIETRGTCRFGLALAAWRRGFDSKVTSDTEGVAFKEAIMERKEVVDEDFLEMLFGELKDRCSRVGIGNDVLEKDEFGLGHIRDALSMSDIPIVLSSTGMFWDEEEIPHWILVSGFEDDTLYVNNPYSDGPETVGRRRFERWLGFRGNNAMLTVSPFP